jgi:hypothetical protein
VSKVGPNRLFQEYGGISQVPQEELGMRMTTRQHTVRRLALLFSVLALSPGAAVTESFAAESWVADAGQAQSVPVGFAVTLDGSASRDTESAPSVIRISPVNSPSSPSGPRPFGECATIAHCGQS